MNIIEEVMKVKGYKIMIIKLEVVVIFVMEESNEDNGCNFCSGHPHYNIS